VTGLDLEAVPGFHFRRTPAGIFFRGAATRREIAAGLGLEGNQGAHQRAEDEEDEQEGNHGKKVCFKHASPGTRQLSHCKSAACRTRALFSRKPRVKSRAKPRNGREGVPHFARARVDFSTPAISFVESRRETL
jgi:hypothetical protein